MEIKIRKKYSNSLKTKRNRKNNNNSLKRAKTNFSVNRLSSLKRNIKKKTPKQKQVFKS